VGLELRRAIGVNGEEAVKEYLTRSDGTACVSPLRSDCDWYMLLEAGVSNWKSSELIAFLFLIVQNPGS